MGQEIKCFGVSGETKSSGTALLETDFVLFRGQQPLLRVKAPFGELQRIAAEDGWLCLAWPDGDLRLQLGEGAANWADRIRNPTSLLDKLGIGARADIAVEGQIGSEFLDLLRSKGVQVLPAGIGPPAEIVVFAVADPADLLRLTMLRDSIMPSGAIWIVAAKGKAATVKEMEIMSAGKAAGLVDVKVAAFSQTHTALKFVIPKALR